MSAPSSSHGAPSRSVGPYLLQRVIGSGAFAEVYLGFNNRTEPRESVAIKKIAREKLNKKLQENLEHEISILKHLTHPNVVTLKDIQRTMRHYYLVLEFCPGGDLSKFVKKRGALTEVQTQHFLSQLAAGLHFLRQKELVHRDLKPQNLLLIEDSHTSVLKIADFGFARMLPSNIMADTLCGSPLYMAPEILKGERYDAKADLWSVGTIVFEMLTRYPPFAGNNHIELLANIERNRLRFKPNELLFSDECWSLLRQLLKANPIERMSFDDFFAHPFVTQNGAVVFAPPSTSVSVPLPSSLLHQPLLQTSPSPILSTPVSEDAIRREPLSALITNTLAVTDIGAPSDPQIPLSAKSPVSSANLPSPTLSSPSRASTSPETVKPPAVNSETSPSSNPLPAVVPAFSSAAANDAIRIAPANSDAIRIAPANSREQSMRPRSATYPNIHFGHGTASGSAPVSSVEAVDEGEYVVIDASNVLSPSSKHPNAPPISAVSFMYNQTHSLPAGARRAASSNSPSNPALTSDSQAEDRACLALANKLRIARVLVHELADQPGRASADALALYCRSLELVHQALATPCSTPGTKFQAATVMAQDELKALQKRADYLLAHLDTRLSFSSNVVEVAAWTHALQLGRDAMVDAEMHGHFSAGIEKYEKGFLLIDWLLTQHVPPNSHDYEEVRTYRELFRQQIILTRKKQSTSATNSTRIRSSGTDVTNGCVVNM